MNDSPAILCALGCEDGGDSRICRDGCDADALETRGTWETFRGSPKYNARLFDSWSRGHGLGALQVVQNFGTRHRGARLLHDSASRAGTTSRKTSHSTR